MADLREGSPSLSVAWLRPTVDRAGANQHQLLLSVGEKRVFVSQFASHPDRLNRAIQKAPTQRTQCASNPIPELKNGRQLKRGGGACPPLPPPTSPFPGRQLRSGDTMALRTKRASIRRASLPINAARAICPPPPPPSSRSLFSTVSVAGSPTCHAQRTHRTPLSKCTLSRQPGVEAYSGSRRTTPNNPLDNNRARLETHPK